MHFQPSSSMGASSPDPLYGQDTASHLSEAECNAFMLAHKENHGAAKDLVSFLQSNDPAAQMPESKRQQLLQICQEIVENRDYLLHSLAKETPVGRKTDLRMTMPLSGHHQTVAKLHRFALQGVVNALVENAKELLAPHLVSMRQALDQLQEACRDLPSPAVMASASHAEQFMSQFANLTSEGMKAPHLGSTLQYASKLEGRVRETAKLVHQLVNLDHDLKLRRAGDSPGTKANRELWHKALQALKDAHLPAAAAHLSALSRLASTPPTPESLHLLGSTRDEHDA